MRYVNEDPVPGSYAVTLILTRREMRSEKIHPRPSGVLDGAAKREPVRRLSTYRSRGVVY